MTGRFFDWLQDRFGFGRGVSCGGIGCGLILLAVFVMLMMGEGVLSLLIVETVDTAEYYVIVMSGLLTMIFIFTLKTESEPMDISKHAL